MKKVIDVLQSVQSKGGSAVLVQRHGSYMTGHARGRYASANEMYAANYSRKEPDCMWPLDFAAIQQCHSQARMLADGDIVVEEIVGSFNGRGHHTGQCISEGFALAGKGWIPFDCNHGFDYPVYDYAVAHEALNTVGDPCVAQWLNGQRPELIGEKPKDFQRRVMSAIRYLINKGGVRIITSHFEIITLIRALAVAGELLGGISEKWMPTKNGGVLIWRESLDYTAHPMAVEYAPDYQLVGEPQHGDLLFRV